MIEQEQGRGEVFKYQDYYTQLDANDCDDYLYRSRSAYEYPCCFCSRVFDQKGFSKNLKYFDIETRKVEGRE